ncbi:C40 family peptidase [Paenisporosarcina indica]|uniref:C40 family peptidase n=1 Tax=Paenisporosarcina indica TaxID=650093 RepID=UPI00094FB735|nr:C40 family peptidase [Paenisporosarcina indica]
MKLQSQLLKVISMITIALLLVLAPLANQADASSGIDSKQLVEAANGVMGVNYMRGGTTAKGFDCSGFIGYVYNKVGVKLPRTSAGMYATGKSVVKKDLQAGDLVFFNTSGKGVSHVGVYIGEGQFAHSSSSKGVSIAKLNDPHYWGSKYIGAKRVATVTQVASAKK